MIPRKFPSPDDLGCIPYVSKGVVTETLPPSSCHTNCAIPDKGVGTVILPSSLCHTFCAIPDTSLVSRRGTFPTMAVTFWPGSSSARLSNRCLTVREMSKYRIVGSRLTNRGVRACVHPRGGDGVGGGVCNNCILVQQYWVRCYSGIGKSQRYQ